MHRGLLLFRGFCRDAGLSGEYQRPRGHAARASLHRFVRQPRVVETAEELAPAGGLDLVDLFALGGGLFTGLLCEAGNERLAGLGGGRGAAISRVGDERTQAAAVGHLGIGH